MFEKEAEEYIMRKDVITENDRVPFDNGYGFQTVSFEDEVKKAFKDGAEFGYNKAKEEMQEQGLALQSDMDKTIEQNISLKEQIEKMKCCQNCKFEDNDCIEEPCSACTRCLGNIKRKGNSDKWEI